MSAFGEIEVVERTTRYRPNSKQAFDALQEHLRQTTPLVPTTPEAPDTSASAPTPAPTPAAPPAPPPVVYQHVPLRGPGLQVDAGKVAPMDRIWDVASTDLCGGLWRTTPWVIEKITRGLIVRPDEGVQEKDGYFLVRRSIQSRLDSACKRLAVQKLQLYIRPCRGGADWEYRVVPNQYAVGKVLRWRGD